MTSRKLTLTTSLIWHNFFVANIQNNIIGSILEKRFSGYQLLANYYLSRRFEASVHMGELGMGFEKDYEMTIKMEKL